MIRPGISASPISPNIGMRGGMLRRASTCLRAKSRTRKGTPRSPDRPRHLVAAQEATTRFPPRSGSRARLPRRPLQRTRGFSLGTAFFGHRSCPVLEPAAPRFRTLDERRACPLTHRWHAGQCPFATRVGDMRQPSGSSPGRRLRERHVGQGDNDGPLGARLFARCGSRNGAPHRLWGRGRRGLARRLGVDHPGAETAAPMPSFSTASSCSCRTTESWWTRR